MDNNEIRTGEVVESGTTGFVTQCYELYGMPALGSLVKTRAGSLELYGIVYNAATTSLEPGRRPLARGQEEAQEEDIYRASPQLLKLLKSEFQSLIVGYKDGDSYRQFLPPDPARIHAFVYTCPPAEVRQFSRSFDFLTQLLNASLPVPPDELAAAALRQMGRCHDEPRPFLVAAGKELAVLLKDDYNLLKSILGRIK
ncbi:MAG: hypothetical protein HYX96_08735 [Chloroflexi bacterium]|nr:hypothetical protein [Chloroflexota bacterium]